jgi:hypothetical protein
VRSIGSVLLAAAVLAVLMSGTAFANFGPHGGYAQDTDECAACHRAHTAFSSATWTTLGSTPTEKSALLVISGGASVVEACYACHGNGAPGASTNVQSGVFDSGPSGASGVATGTVVTSPPPAGEPTATATTIYMTDSSFGATLNGGGFEHLGGPTGPAPTSTHQLDMGSATAPMWGNGSSLPQSGQLDCASCHDPHGSSNYRLLKDVVGTPNGNVTVGGYIGSGQSAVPNPWVISAETNYPIEGWLKGNAGAAQIATYLPDYTSYKYAVNNGDSGGKSFSGWCAGCHTQYNQKSSPYDYLTTINNGGMGSSATFHRHPVDTSLEGGDPNNLNRAFPTPMLIDPGLPLEAYGTANPYQNYLTCLTCHYAHGTVASMNAGWARGGITTVTISGEPTAGPFQDPTYAGVQPTYKTNDPTGSGLTSPMGTSALLRYDNRGVCERCHNK